MVNILFKKHSTKSYEKPEGWRELFTINKELCQSIDITAKSWNMLCAWIKKTTRKLNSSQANNWIYEPRHTTRESLFKTLTMQTNQHVRLNTLRISHTEASKIRKSRALSPPRTSEYLRKFLSLFFFSFFSIVTQQKLAELGEAGKQRGICE